MGMMQISLDGVIANAERQRMGETGHENDYKSAEGLLMCGNCHTRRQMRLDVPGVGMRIVPVLCQCGKEARDRREAEERAKKEMENISKLRRLGITDDKYRTMTLATNDGQDKKTTALVHRYVDKRAEMLRENIGLLFHGDVGGGKTFWAAAIANAMIDHGTSAMITTVPKLINAMSRDFEADKADVLHRISRVGFLVLDDIGFERQTSYAAEKLYEIIDTRYQARRPLIVTTNLSLEEIANPQLMEYKRVFDRIIEMCQPVHIAASGRRKAIAMEKSKRAREILGL